MSEFRLEFRSYNVGADGLLGPVGAGFAHNFLNFERLRTQAENRSCWTKLKMIKDRGRNQGERARPAHRSMMAVSLVLTSCLSFGCIDSRADPSLDRKHPFERAMIDGGPITAAVAKLAAEELEKLVDPERTIAAFERALVAQGAVCSSARALHCVYRTRKRYTPFLYPPVADYYELDFIVTAARSREARLTVCYGDTTVGGKWDEVPRVVIPQDKHCIP